MEVKEIDFSRYSSLRIGGKIPVYILTFDDVQAKLIDYKPDLQMLKSQDSAEKTKLEYVNQIKSSSNLFLSDSLVSIPNTQTCNESGNKPHLLMYKTLHFHTLLKSCDTDSCLDFGMNTLRIIGRANNLLVSPNAKNLAVLGSDFNYISDIGRYIEVGAGVSSLQAFLYFKKQNLRGLEFLKNLPGVIGALCNMNAGMKNYEIKDSLASLNINGQWVDSNLLGLHYRGRDSKGIIFAARFYKQRGFRKELLNTFALMRQSHPSEPSCGSCFKNPPNDYAGRLLESAGLKGFRINDIAFSEKHANFLVNLGHACFEDAIKLIAIAKEKVYQQFKIKLECEVKICE